MSSCAFFMRRVVPAVIFWNHPIDINCFADSPGKAQRVPARAQPRFALSPANKNQVSTSTQ